ncbi:MAG: glycosyl hydrolase family 18 protein [Anaerolineales bacterium]
MLRFHAGKSLIGFGLLVSLLGCASAAPAPSPTARPTSMPPTASPAPSPAPFRIVGYVTDAVIPTLIPYDQLTHINYAFLLPRPDGTFEAPANPWKIQSIVQSAHARGVKVLISVGGWGQAAEFESLAGESGTRSVFVSGVAALLKQYDLDGVDIDWEYPDPGASMQNYLTLMQALRAALPGQLLTAAVPAIGGARYDLPKSDLQAYFDAVDFLNIMAYDGGTPHSPYTYSVAALDYWLGAGLPPAKAVLGVPFYARDAGTGSLPYSRLIQADAGAAAVDEFNYDGVVYNYNGIPTIERKTRLARARASGIMIWALEDDTPEAATSLLTAIYQTAHGSLTP